MIETSGSALRSALSAGPVEAWAICSVPDDADGLDRLARALQTMAAFHRFAPSAGPVRFGREGGPLRISFDVSQADYDEWWAECGFPFGRSL